MPSLIAIFSSVLINFEIIASTVIILMIMAAEGIAITSVVSAPAVAPLDMVSTLESLIATLHLSWDEIVPSPLHFTLFQSKTWTCKETEDRSVLLTSARCAALTDKNVKNNSGEKMRDKV
jgi:hypothetical protein